MEIRNDTSKNPVKAVLFDFDGTVSTLRCGWEKVMAPLFFEVLDDGKTDKALLEKKVADYIDESTGIQTILQMKWLAGEVEKSGRTPEDIWEYKRMYNDRLMLEIKRKLENLAAGKELPENYLMAGACEFLSALKERGIKIFVASGTDDPDVKNEAAKLGVIDFFDEIKGAPLHEESCSKEAVIKRLLEEGGYSGDELAVCGDGKVEIALGKAKGARTIGLASNERERCGVDETKRARLIAADADIIVGDFTEKQELLKFLGL
ncbi:MAG: HAD hydrolase-like protein [Clostridia bacterium]|nr:HAD hydrolase-like protein [Clostridia bacterium]